MKVFPKLKTQVKVFVFCGIYSKPNSKTKTVLNDHIAINFHLLKMKHEAVKFFFLGDFNDHKPDNILQLSPQLRQVVHHPTCGKNILDLVVTDAHTLYDPPYLEPPLQPNDPSSASPSDHYGNVLVPRSHLGPVSSRIYKVIKVRPITQSQLNILGSAIVMEDWSAVISENNTNDKLEVFTNTAFTLLDTFAPTKEVKISCDDPSWMNSRIKTVIRKRNREFDKNGKTEKWKSLKNKCRILIQKAKTDFATSFISNLKDKDPKTWMSSMKKLGKANHEKDHDTWHFVDEDKSDQVLTDEIAEYFADISGNFTPLKRALFPFIPFPNSPFVSEVPCFPQEHEIYDLLKHAKKTSSVPHDLPIPFLKEFLPELVKPITSIYTSSITTGIFPSRWKNEYVSPHPKVLPPSSYADLRNLSLTEFLAKSFEKFILKGTQSVKGLLHYISKYLDPNQYAVPGSSCSHALIKMINFILSATDDSNQPAAVINLMADWSKAFNKCNHNIIMRILTAMKVPMWMLRLIMSYLEKRKMILRFRGCSSEAKDMPGGMPQGTLLGVILYILYINPVGFPSEVTIKISDKLHQYWNILDNIPPLPVNNTSLPDSVVCTKFMDDATLQESVNVVTELATNYDRSGPLPSWELGIKQSSGKVLPKTNSKLQSQIDTLKKLSDEREMSLNSEKTCILVVNFTQKHQFSPLLQIPGCPTIINRVLETKLLGYWFTHDMKTRKHIDHILKIAYKRLWAIRKLKKAGISDIDILHFYNMKIRSVLESNCVVFHSMLTLEETQDIERIQKIVVKIILEHKYTDYTQGCLVLGITTLKLRRIKLCLNFGLKCLSNSKFKNLFQPNSNLTVRNPDKFEIPLAKTTRNYNSSLLYITRLLNTHCRE